jgi:chromosome segregation ATPase
MPDVAALNREAAHLREQAKALHDGADRAVRSGVGDLNTRVQTASRAQEAAQAEATRADGQVAHARQNESAGRAEAARVEAEAAKVAPKDAAEAQELREHASKLRAQADGWGDTAVAAERAAVTARAAAEATQAEYGKLEAEAQARYKPIHEMERVADELDRKAAYLEDAARLERKATVAEIDDDKVTAQEQRQLAEDAVQRADRIKPDVSTIDPKVLRDAGVDLSKAPGTELMDPTASAAMDPGAGIDSLDTAIRTPIPGDEAVQEEIHDLTAPLNEVHADTPTSDAGYRLGAEMQAEGQTFEEESFDSESTATPDYEPEPQASPDTEPAAYVEPEAEVELESDVEFSE